MADTKDQDDLDEEHDGDDFDVEWDEGTTRLPDGGYRHGFVYKRRRFTIRTYHVTQGGTRDDSGTHWSATWAEKATKYTVHRLAGTHVAEGAAVEAAKEAIRALVGAAPSGT